MLSTCIRRWSVLVLEATPRESRRRWLRTRGRCGDVALYIPKRRRCWMRGWLSSSEVCHSLRSIGVAFILKWIYSPTLIHCRTYRRTSYTFRAGTAFVRLVFTCPLPKSTSCPTWRIHQTCSIERTTGSDPGGRHKRPN